MGEARQVLGRIPPGAGATLKVAMVAVLIGAPAGCTDKEQAVSALPGAAVPSILAAPGGQFTADMSTANLVLCPAGGSDSTPASQDALRATLTRRWLSCLYTFRGDEDGDALGTQGAGIEIKSDGRYWHLARDGAGKLVGTKGVDSEGTVTFSVNASGAAQTTFRSDLNQVLVAHLLLTAHPTVLIIRTANAEHRYIPGGP